MVWSSGLYFSWTEFKGVLLTSLLQPTKTMSPASRSLYYFGFYLLATGITLTVFPNALLSLVGVPETTEVWIHLLGVVVFAIGLYYVFMAPTNNFLFLTLSVYARISVFLWFVIFIVINLAPIQLLPFGLIDLAGAIWTYTALKKS